MPDSNFLKDQVQTMTTKDCLDTDNDLFSSSLHGDVLILKQKRHILHLSHDINKVQYFYDYLDSILNSNKFKAMIFFGESQKEPMTEYIRFLCESMSSFQGKVYIYRLFNVFNRFITTLASLNAVTVYVGRDHVSLFRLNIGLAYDYRILAEGTVFENLNADIGLLTKGSGYFMPRLLGVKKTTEVLQWRTFSSEEALQLGLVDRIVPLDRLEEETLEFVKMHLQQQTSTFLAIRKLLKCDQQALKRSLDLEDELIKERLEAPDFKHVFEKYCLTRFGKDVETLLATG
jgi:2-(1,2-epoxy-1,2-dihydrophenyl)acetyl-CoA isomerase